ncbi:MFS transporter [Variovorax sp. LjRoot290]|uniref:MFS transporter n=1 Tax=Variovorax sp. LjRoot290 TaxID=3342316 RepID=UPI003ECEDF9F
MTFSSSSSVVVPAAATGSATPGRRSSAPSVLLLTTAVQALVSMAALMVPVLGPRIVGDLQLPGAVLGYYVALVYLAAVPGSVLGGDAVLRYGPVRVSQASLVLCAGGLLLVASGIWWLGCIGALLIGLGYGPVTPASSHMLALAAPSGHRGLVFSIKQTGVPLGGALAGFVGPRVAEPSGWSMALVVGAIFCVVCAMLAQWWRSPNDDDRQPSHPMGLCVFSEMALLLKTSTPLRTLAIAAFFFSMFQLSLSTYLVTYMHQGFGYSLVMAGFMMSMAQGAGIVGRLVWGYVADHLLRGPRLLLVLGAVMTVGCLAMAALPRDWSQGALLCVVVLVSACALGWNGFFLAEVARQAPPGMASRATGAILSCLFAGVVIGPPFFGSLASATGNYSLAFVVIAIAPLISTLTLFRRARALDPASAPSSSASPSSTPTP